MSAIKKLFKVDRKTLRETLILLGVSSEEYKENLNALTTIALRKSTKLRLQRFMSKGVTFDQGLDAILTWLEERADKPV